MWLYILVRTQRPAVVVETGVQNGCSTEMILWALYRNAIGRLYSVDSGPTSTDGSHATDWHKTDGGLPGKNIVKGLKDRWELSIGLSCDQLPGLCERLKVVDMFWHDSDHSDNNVTFEFDTVMPYIYIGGVLCLHDFSDQRIMLPEPEYRLVIPQHQPELRAWKKVSMRAGTP
jgi:hypothetical protein